MIDRAEQYFKELAGRKRTLRAYRCGKCRKRRVLARELWEYIRPPECLGCGARDWRMDQHRSLEHKYKVGAYEICQCGGVEYNHKPGSTKWCHQSSQEVTEDDMKERFSLRSRTAG